MNINLSQLSLATFDFGANDDKLEQAVLAHIALLGHEAKSFSTDLPFVMEPATIESFIKNSFPSDTRKPHS